MCGIFGHYIWGRDISRKEIVDILFRGLRRLEYRGYDSAGLSIESEPFHQALEDDSAHSPAPIIVKSKGKLAALEADVAAMSMDLEVEFNRHVGTYKLTSELMNLLHHLAITIGANVGFVCTAISHTRWATHGEPSVQNCHPITSGPTAAFTVVHNGIITNFSKLKSFLEEEGEQFHTETDTEVIAKLCSHLYASLEERVTFSELVMMVLRKLEGAYAILIQSIMYPGELVCCRKGSPVVLGLKDSAKASRRRFGSMRETQESNCYGNDTLECFIASDDKAIIEHTRVCNTMLPCHSACAALLCIRS